MEKPANISSEVNVISYGNSSSNVSSTSVVLTDEILVSVGIVMLLENIISILLLSKCTRINFQIRILSLNLAVSDLFTGFVLAVPNTLLYEKFRCDIKKYAAFLFINVSLLIVSIMNLDRCFVFAYAMRYYSFITKKLMRKLCCFAWITGFPLTFGMFFGFDAKYGFSCELMAFHEMNAINSIFKGVLLCIVVVNFLMFGYLLYHSRKKLSRTYPQQKQPMPHQYSRMVRKLSVVTGVFLMAYFPFMMIMTFPILDKSSGIGKGIYSFTATMVLLNSACNPVFYVWRFSEPRYHVKRWFCFWNKRMREKIDRLHNQQYASYDIYTISTSV
ncbi:melanocortin receptor 3-like [Ostrea edulis]|uniref:melanocortin receptor 3-like n=1 Tax=Ostrea edulis TaxID=37623 RepID=UPI0024AF071C|nr:melanocortin receptor 3-like [Ostrea edulis]